MTFPSPIFDSATINTALTYTATGGTVARTAENRAADILNVKDYGAVGNGAIDDSGAIQATFNAAVITGQEVWFPAGNYVLNSSISVSSGTSNLVVRGAGVGVVTLLCNAGGIAITTGANALITVADLCIVNNSGSIAGTGLSITANVSAESTRVWLRNLSLRGDVGPPRTTAWQTAISLINIAGPILEGLTVFAPNSNGISGPTGIYISGTISGAVYSTDTKIHSTLIQGCRYGLEVGPYAQGVSVSDSNIIGNDYGIYWPASSGTEEWLSVCNSHFNCTVRGVYGINIGWTNILSSLFLRFDTVASPNWAAIDLEGGNNIVVNGNNIYGNASATENGVILTNITGQPSAVIGNAIANLVGAAILITGNSAGLSVVGNTGNGVTSLISDTSGNPNQYVGNNTNHAPDVTYDYTNHVLTAAQGVKALSSTTNAVLLIDRPAGFNATVHSETAGSPRWNMYLANSTAEAGANAGSDFQLARCDDSGNEIDMPLAIDRSSGLATFVNPVQIGGHGIQYTANSTNYIAFAWDNWNLPTYIDGTLQGVLTPATFTNNGTVSVSLTAVAPAGAHATVQGWLTIKDASGTLRYVPYF